MILKLVILLNQQAFSTISRSLSSMFQAPYARVAFVATLCLTVFTAPAASQSGAALSASVANISSVSDVKTFLLHHLDLFAKHHNPLPPLPSYPPTASAATKVYSMNYGLNDCTLDGEDLVCAYNGLVNGADLLALSPDGRTAYLSKATYIRPLQPQAQAKVQATLANTRNQFSIYVCPNILDFPIVCGPPTGSNLDGPSDIAISPDGKTAYVTNIAGDFGGGSIDAVVICTIEGLHLNCSQPTGVDFKNPTGIALNPDGSIVYVANYAAEGSVTACEVSGDVLKNCQVNNISAFGSFGIAVSRDGKTAYISTQNSTLGGITICEVSDLTVGPCQSELNPDDVFSIPGYLSLNKDGTQLFASNLYSYHYYTSINAGGAVSTCSISGESLVSCSNATAINYASGVAAY